MTNFEDVLNKDIEAIKTIVRLCDDIGVRKRDNKPIPCVKLDCEECLFEYKKCSQEDFARWVDEEYTKPEPTFECDELVEVSTDGEKCKRRYYWSN